MPCTLSIVVPCFNEAEVLPLLYDRLRNLVCPDGISIEVILVDDGSTDSTWQQISSMAIKHQEWRAIKLSRNFGHQQALWAGFEVSRGDAVFVIDADLQDPPELLSDFVRMWRSGSDVVYGVRQNRKEIWWKRHAYRLFYRILGKVADIDIPLDSGDFCLMDRRVVDQMLKFNEPNPFVRGVRAWVGFEQQPLFYDRDARAAGREKYKVRHLLDLAVNGLFSYSRKPVRLLLVLGALVSIGSLTLTMVAAIFWLITGTSFGLPISTLFLVGFVGSIGGLNLLGLGVIGEYTCKAFETSKSRPVAIIGEVAGEEPVFPKSTAEPSDDQGSNLDNSKPVLIAIERELPERRKAA